MASVKTYVVYRRGWPVCSGPLEYVAEMTGSTPTGILSRVSHGFSEFGTGVVRVEMDEEELTRRGGRP